MKVLKVCRKNELTVMVVMLGKEKLKQKQDIIIIIIDWICLVMFRLYNCLLMAIHRNDYY